MRKTGTDQCRKYSTYYAQHSWPVFPLACKIPYYGMHDHRDAPTDREKVQKWWSEHPKANIGLATGRAVGIIIVDMDVPKGYFFDKLLKEAGLLHVRFHDLRHSAANILLSMRVSAK